MEFWEFLIQREGDRSWLPLESPDVEMLEGRYRMVARSSRSSMPVDVAIAHTLLDEHPPRRRFQKRQGFTNADGVMVVFPYTWLQPGLWEFHCSGEQITAAGRNAWQQSVQLHVVAQESEVSDDWVPELPGDRSAFASDDAEPTPAPVAQPCAEEQEEDIEAIASTLPREEPSAEESNDINPFGTFSQPAVNTPATAAPPPEASASEPAYEPSSAEQSSLPSIDVPSALSAEALRRRAEADSDAVMAALMEGLAFDDEDDEPIAAEAAALSAESANAGVDAEEDMAPSMPPLSPDSVCLVLQDANLVVQPAAPLVLNGRVEAVGEPETPYLPPVALQITLRDPQTAAVVLETRRSLTSRLLPCAFSCQVALPENLRTRLLMGELALITLATPSNDPTILVSENFTVTASLDELLEAIANNVSADLKAAFGEDRPPAELDLSLLNAVQKQGDRPATAPKPTFAPQPTERQILPPKLNLKPTSKTEPPGSVPIDLPQMKPLSEVTNPTEAKQEKPSEPFIPIESDPLEEADDVLKGLESVELEEQKGTRTAEDEPNLATTAEELAFRSLDLQNRFLQRLNSLATDAELSNFLGDRLLPGKDNPLSEREVVIEDDAPAPSRRSLSFQTSPRTSYPDSDTPLSAEPLPTPQIFVKQGELVSGETVDVTVTLPPTTHPVGVKLWLQDLQNRVLLDGPHWLMNFVPNSKGDREAWTSLTVPHGCLEVQFEAIAIELATQRESHKVSCDRAVVPPDLPSLSLDELEL